ncbi:MAG TPA: hypothetical protein VFX47_07835 [Gammaproteobacteria bacterium]|nr:hypothetical protein [Gammaproteobacteria bacterium]
MNRLLRTVVPVCAVLLCTACASAPERTPTQLAAQQLASLYVADAAAWHIAAPPGRGYRIAITRVDGRNSCSPSHCPTRVTLAAGRADIELLCIMLIDNLQLPKRSARYSGEFLAGHVYRIQPLSVLPDCRVQVRDVTGQTP